MYGLIVLTAVAMGFATPVRKLAVPDLTTTAHADSNWLCLISLAGGANPRWKTRLASIVTMSAGVATGATLLRYGAVAPLAGEQLSAVLAYIVARESERVTR